MRIQFTKSPTGLFNLGYSAGDTVDLPERQAIEILEADFAVKVEQPELSMEQLKAELTVRGKKFPKNATKEELCAML